MQAMNVDELMTEMGWVRRLARSLVGPEAADDIAQDAYLVASEHAPEDGRPLRPWLHRVVTNLARMRHRSTTRQTAREQGIVASAVATPDELVERIEAQRALADEVLVLLVGGSGFVWKLVVKRSSDSSSTTAISSGSKMKPPATLSTTIAGKPIDVPTWVALPNGKKRHLAGRV